ncbi:MAG: tetratricopeptide repeat protein [Desulfobacterales bacterium]
MGLFSFITGKSPEEIEMIGDGYQAAGEYGAAKVEYDKALEKAEKKSPEKQALIRRLAEKANQAREALAGSHINSAEELIRQQSYQEAEDLLYLAYELTGDEKLKTDIKAKARSLHQMPAGATEAGDLAEPFAQLHESTEAADTEDDEEAAYFHLLVSSLPEEMQEAYESYGQAFMEGYVALNQGEFEIAVSAFRTAMTENPDPDSWIALELATAYMHLGQPENARETVETYLQSNPESLRAYQLLCEIYWDAGDFAAAADLLNRSPKDLQQSGPVQMLLGETYYQAGRYEAARDVFLDCGEQFGNEELISRALAKTYEAMGDFDKARRLYGEILNNCTKCGARADPFIKSRFAELSFQSGDTSNLVLEMFLSLVREDPDNRKAYYDRIGKIYEAAGHASEARRYYGFAESAAG